MTIWDILLLIISLLLISLVVMQSSKDDIQQSFTGEKSELFKHQKLRGFELFISRTTLVVSILFIVLAFIASFIVERWV